MTEWEEVLEHLQITEQAFNDSLQERIAEGLETSHNQERHAEIKPSPIHGEGVFASHQVEGGEYALVVQSYGRLTPEGAKVNHSHDPTAELVHTPSGHIFLRAILEIEAGTELTHDYRLSYWKSTP